MPFSNRPDGDVRKTTQTSPLTPTIPAVLQARFALRRCMANSALGKLYWAEDLQQTQDNGEANNVLVFTLAPLLTQNTAFEQALRQVLPGYQRATPFMPIVSHDGITPEGMRWYVIRNVSGMLLSERLQELDERGMPVADALCLADSISTAVASFRPEGVYGYLEPNTTMIGDDGIRLLTAPIVSALRLTKTGNADSTTPNLHSGYLSPEVLQGHLPIARDDTFSVASVFYHLLKGEPPFGKYSTLDAAARNVFPTSSRKLRQDAWNVLKLALSLQRKDRQATPSILLRQFQAKQKNGLMLPVTAGIAASVVAIAGYMAIANWNKPDTAPSATPLANLTPTAPNTTAEPEPKVVNELAAPLTSTSTTTDNQAAIDKEVNTAVDQASVDGSVPENIDALVTLAQEAINRGNLVSDDSTQTGAIDYLRKIYAQAPNNPQLTTLLAKVIDDQQSEAEIYLSDGLLVDKAAELLKKSDNLITEFNFADGLKKQVALESKLQAQQRAAALALNDPTMGSNTPSEQSDPSRTDITPPATPTIDPALNLAAAGDGSAQAKEAQAQALTALQKNNLDKARQYLDASQTLIAQYSLEKLASEQLDLERRFRETRDEMGIFAAKDTPRPTQRSLAKTDTAEEKKTSKSKNNNASNAVVASSESSKPSNKSDTAHRERAATVTSAPPHRANVQSVSAPTPAPTYTVQPHAAPPVVQRPAPSPQPVAPVTQRPAAAPQVPGLMEVPLDMIK